MSYGGYNVEKLEFLGKGIHGKVYKIDDEKCLKVFYKARFYKSELETLIMAQGYRQFPRLYSYGDKYIIREFIDGIELDKYLKKNPLTIEISKEIIEAYEALKGAGFSRVDAVLFHLFVTGSGRIRIIDTARVMKEKSDYPKLILKGLKELDCRETFLEHLKILRPKLYNKWR